MRSIKTSNNPTNGTLGYKPLPTTGVLPENKVVLSHDLALFSDAGNSKWDPKKRVWFTEAYDQEDKLIDFTFISKVIIPRLLEAGVTENQVKLMTIDNPQLIFEESLKS